MYPLCIGVTIVIDWEISVFYSNIEPLERIKSLMLNYGTLSYHAPSSEEGPLTGRPFHKLPTLAPLWALLPALVVSRTNDQASTSALRHLEAQA